jgi:hypothetical protein
MQRPPERSPRALALRCAGILNCSHRLRRSFRYRRRHSLHRRRHNHRSRNVGRADIGKLDLTLICLARRGNRRWRLARHHARLSFGLNRRRSRGACSTLTGATAGTSSARSCRAASSGSSTVGVPTRSFRRHELRGLGTVASPWRLGDTENSLVEPEELPRPAFGDRN